MEVQRKMLNKQNFTEYIKPALVLVSICLVVSFALAQTYAITLPIIEANEQKAADEARALVLPEGDSFTPYEGSLVDGVEGYYVANNKAGVAVTATGKSFGGKLTTMVGIDADGKITGVTVTKHADTPGLGTKAMTVDYLAQYNGKTADEVLVSENIKKNPNMIFITGATISSNGVYYSVQAAMKQFQEAGGVN